MRHLSSFESGNVDDLRAKLGELLAKSDDTLRTAARDATVARWSWAKVARRLLAALSRTALGGPA